MHRTVLLALLLAPLAFVPMDSAWAADDKKSEDSKSGKKKSDKDKDEDKDEDTGGGEIDLDIFKDSDKDDIGLDLPVERLQDKDKVEGAEPLEVEDEHYEGDKKGPGINLDEDEDSVKIGGPGQDNARIYRDFKDQVQHIGPDEEILSWEQYLRQYPRSLFRSQIQARIEDLQGNLYEARVPGSVGFGDLDAGRREVDLARPVLLDSIDPRTRLSGGFEVGFPQYVNLMADYEHQLLRELSVHGGLRHRYTGWNIEVGPKWALVKSARTNTIVTLMADLHANTLPFYPGLRPQVAFGKRFGSEKALDVQAQLGVDFLMQSPASLLYVGGANVTWRASNTVRFFLESSVNMKHLFWDQGSTFRFNVATFGITFGLGKKADATLGASAPYTTNYWGYHYGSVVADFNYTMN
jgi:hypothetical protein